LSQDFEFRLPPDYPAVELETTHVVSFREGRAVSVQVYRDRADALEATGLSA
jgi:ketosteroid isomerase-like protein